MARKRRGNRQEGYKGLNQWVIMFRFKQTSPNWWEWDYYTVSLRQALDWKKNEEAKRYEVGGEYAKLLMFREEEKIKATTSKTTPSMLKMTASVALALSKDAERRDEHKRALEHWERENIERIIVWPLFDVLTPRKNDPDGDSRSIRACTIRPRVGQREMNQYANLMRKADGPKVVKKELKPRTQAVHYADMVPAA